MTYSKVLSLVGFLAIFSQAGAMEINTPKKTKTTIQDLRLEKTGKKSKSSGEGNFHFLINSYNEEKASDEGTIQIQGNRRTGMGTIDTKTALQPRIDTGFDIPDAEIGKSKKPKLMSLVKKEKTNQTTSLIATRSHNLSENNK